MTNAQDFITKSKTLNAKDVKTDAVYRATLTVIGTVTETMTDGKIKLALCFDGIEKILVLNQTNLKTMIGVKGENTDAWKQTEITLILVPSRFNGQTVDSIVINVRR